MKDIARVGFNLPSEKSDGFIKLDSLTSLSDYDIVIFNPSMFNTNYYLDSPTSSYDGDSLYDSNSSNRIKKHSEHWKKEIENFLDSGKNVFINLCPLINFYVRSGGKNISGTGRNQKTTHHVAPRTNYDFLPIHINILNSSGKIVIPTAPLIQSFFKGLKKFIKYEVHISNKDLISLFSTKNGDKTLGGKAKIRNGNLIFLPYMDFDLPEFTEYHTYEGGQWTEEAVKAGKIFTSHIIQVDKSLKNHEEKSPKPNWLEHKNYNLKESEITKKTIIKVDNNINTLKEKKEILIAKLLEQESLKDLLFETGKPLENAVIKALEILGYQAENYDDGSLELDQVIISPEGDRFIGECEGRDSKAIDIGKFRQLQDSMNEDFYREDIEEKAYGLLFGNPERLAAPSKRKMTFTDKCKKGAKREGIGLVKTTELFRVAKYLMENKEESFKKLCRNSIKEQLGEIIDFPKTKKAIKNA